MSYNFFKRKFRREISKICEKHNADSRALTQHELRFCVRISCGSSFLYDSKMFFVKTNT